MTRWSVFVPRRLGRMVSSDARNVSRDPTLMFAILLGILPTLFLALWREPLDAAAQAAVGIEAFSRYLVPIVVCLPAMLLGWVTGFLLLEDRDDGTLLALEVTPMGKGGFFLYRASITALAAALLTLFAAILLLPKAGPALAAMLMILVSIQAVFIAFLFPAVARNKVQGLGLTKVVNILSLAPLLAIIPSPWRYIGGAVPAFWIGELLHLSDIRYLPQTASAIIALLVHFAAAWMLWRKVIGRSG